MNPDMRENEQTLLLWAKSACDTLIARYAPYELPPANRWHYHQGVFLHGMMRLWERTKEERYFQYAKAYVDHLVDDNGSFLFARDELDAIQAGLLLFPIYQRTGERKYRLAAEKLCNLLGTLNRTSEGGFWHKDKYPNQMWLDGLYMGGVFAVVFADCFGQTNLYEEVLHQEKLMRSHMKDHATGLLYHAWDESRKAPWAHPETGCSPEFWGRSVGWYAAAVADILEYVPKGARGRDELAEAFRELIKSLIRYQDQPSGLWYQVLDKGNEPDNWLETSCSALFIYAIAKAVRLQCADERCLAAANAGFAGLLRKVYKDEQNHFVLPDICIGTSAGDYRNYVTRPVSSNDLHGVGAFVLACLELDKAKESLALKAAT
ncbi:MAG TPA: glycoside hydrolase family 88 protein [Bacilli bacterium]